ncbi:MAG: 1-deoxy-D-xylulose-5-phosphate reductoisomerase [Candidatus Diapherotrites archaeon CG10_big_fil_rev_8_21_14_0_10_31_34]|nr:MAG: 1-deoxy-D-xylulose-5-phosphate reductoisomerase [Candidatus Diapherotrites archaeon CG10_big_fil_rev_8_21_14_0_10_31_34]PJA19178.1 MAG: 1-deoxy-D-xylulose-5-phosphate reductoisomerase [Candidatus Diapherotrites archaeon CG_4_10_14_0_2_um_filter_31_5]
MKKISLLGSTGSIGTQTLDVIKGHPKEFKVIGLAAFNETEKILEQIKEFRPEKVCLFEKKAAEELEKKIGKEVEVVSGIKGLEEIAVMQEAEQVVVAVVGAIGIKPTMKAIQKKKNVALANKETLVAAGQPIMKAVKKTGITLMPIDSEHSALFQCLNGEERNKISKVLITCSGGPFRGKKISEYYNSTPEQALGHPTWSMGSKITVDSSTLMNKGLEVIEAKWLYDLSFEEIKVIVHPQSLIHSMIEFVDGSIMAQIGTHDMRTPIQYALSYPKRIPNNFPRLDLFKDNNLTFEKPDLENFPCLKYAFEAGKKGGTLPAVMNAANEIAVWSFLDKKIAFGKIPEIVKEVMDEHKNRKADSIETVLEADKKARETAKKIIEETQKKQ